MIINEDKILTILSGLLAIELTIFSCLINSTAKTVYAEEDILGNVKDVPAKVEKATEVSQSNSLSNSLSQVSTPKYNYTQTLTKSGGVYYYNGKKETYYSSRVTYHYMTPQWKLDQNGFYHDSNGYFVVSSSDYSKGTVINISMGAAIVLDCGCPHGVVDIYCNW